jgi:uncharacterized protein (TIGR01777 family)
MKVAVTGATGLLGRALARELASRGDELTALSRDAARGRAALGAGVEVAEWPEPKAAAPPLDALRGRDAVVNLLGEPIAQRWTEDAKREIRESRVLPTRNLVDALSRLDEATRPEVLVSVSGSNWYAPRGDQPVDESGAPGTDFLAGVTASWEEEAGKAKALGMRVVIARLGVVLSDSGGALEKMLPPFKLGVGGPVAGGRQYVPWVHADDVAGAIAFLIETEAAHGPVNVASPNAVTNRELSKALGRVLRRPAVAPVPAFAVKLLYGEMATIVTTGVRVVPGRLTELGYEFRHADLEPALRDVTTRS